MKELTRWKWIKSLRNLHRKASDDETAVKVENTTQMDLSLPSAGIRYMFPKDSRIHTYFSMGRIKESKNSYTFFQQEAEE